MPVGDFRRLEVWQRARLLCSQIYQVTRHYPADEKFGLIAQTRRAAVSVAANIAEGRGKNNDRELHRYLGIAIGSATEVECLVVLAEDLKFISPDESAPLIESAARMQSMIAVLQRRIRACR